MALLPVSFTRSLHLATSNLWRNKLLTTATVLIMALILFIFNIIYSVNVLAQEAINELEAKVDLIIYLEEDADALLVTKLSNELEAFPETTSVNYISKDEALESLMDKYSDDIDPFETYGLENPLPASLQVLTVNPEDHETILAYLNQSDYKSLLLDVESNLENQQIVTNLTQITNFSEKLLFGVIVIFLLGSLLIIANAIHVTVFSRRKEIEIMRAVGANLSFVRSPFILEGIFYGIMAVALSSLLLYAFQQSIDLSQLTFFAGEINYVGLFAIQLLVSVIIGVATSLVSINYHLKKRIAT